MQNKPSICVIGGAGHVGLPLSLAFTTVGKSVLIYDINQKTSEKIRKGVLPFFEEGAETLLKNALLKDLLHLTNDPLKIAGIENIIIPNWKPFKAINWLAKRAINNNNIPNYLFWESNGITYFKSVESLLTQQVKQEFIFSPIIAAEQKKEQLAQGRIQLDSLEIINQFHTIRNTENGLYASKLITHDIVKKKIQQHTFGLNRAYASDITHTDVYMPISSIDTYYTVQDRFTFAPQGDGNNEGDNIQSYYDSKVMFHPKHNQMYALNSNDLYDNHVEDWKLKRNALILGLDQIKLQITFSGLSYLSVGHKVHITVPSAEKVLEQNPGKVKNPDELIDKYLSGTYLIIVLKHMIAWNSGKPVYTMLAEVTKDALADVPSYRGRSK